MTWLHEFGELLRSGLLAVPLPVVRALFVSVPLGVLLWVLRLPNSATTPPGGARRWDENLKLWASVALVIQIVIYWLL